MSQSCHFIILPLLSQSLKSFHVLASKFTLNQLTKLYSLLQKTTTENWSGICFIPCSSWNLGYIDQTRRQLKDRLNEHLHKVKNEEIYSSFIVSHCWSYNHYFDFTKVSIISSPISTSHLNSHEAFYTLKNSNNFVNDFFYVPYISRHT